jgi:organic hydroperoxide reductase OsmC/OhrA
MRVPHTESFVRIVNPALPRPCAEFGRATHLNLPESRMSDHLATIRWERGDAAFVGGKFSRVHTWSFDGGITLEAAASPSVVPAMYNSHSAVDPEEAFVASIASCHMLTYLFFAMKGGFIVDSYEDQAVGTMTKGENGVPWVSKVTLRPRVVYGGDKRPNLDEESHLHHEAHDKCFIANSVKSEITVEPAR